MSSRTTYNLRSCVGSTSAQVNSHCRREYIKTMKAYFNQCEDADGHENKKAVVAKMFEYMGKCRYKWEMETPRMRDMVRSKLIEFSRSAPSGWITQCKESLLSRIIFD